MKKIVSKTAVVLSVVLFAISICSVSSNDCLKGLIPIQNIIVNSEEVLYGVRYGDMSFLPHKALLFYIGLILILLSSLICFKRTDKIRGVVVIISSLVPILLVIVTHNYIWFLISINIYLMVNSLIDFTLKDKVIILGNIIAIIIGILNLIQLIQHLRLKFNSFDIQTLKIELVTLSDTTLKFFILWLIPYTILLIKDIVVTFKSLRNAN